MKISEAIELLRAAGVENPSYDARALFAKFGEKTSAELLLGDTECCGEEVVSAVARRAMREPLQYIIGEVDFYRETYKVTPDCLIPRQDTEILVDFAVHNIPTGKRFFDLCTGSGCVAVSTLKNTRETTAKAIDISSAALSVARENAERNGVFDRVDFIAADVFEYEPKDEVFAVLSNPPYVTENAYKALAAEIYHEPKIAFVGGASALVFYEKILASYKDKIEKGGFFAFEIGYDQGDALTDLAKRFGKTAQIIKDYSGLDRVAVIK
jgi:release factor glutamine methyltransferase